MGWWRTGQGDDIIGDGPADTLTSAFNNNSAVFTAQKGRKPTLQETLDAIAIALHSNPEEFVSDGKKGRSIRRVVATMEPESKKLSSGESSKADETLVAAFCDAFEAIAVEYEQSEMKRKPRLSELLMSIQFVLGYRPEEYLSDIENVSVKEIVAEFD